MHKTSLNIHHKAHVANHCCYWSYPTSPRYSHV